MAKPKAAGVLLGQVPNPLPPLRASTPAPSPVPIKREPAPSKREPSLVILSRHIANAVQRPVKGARLTPPAPPPSSNRSASYEAGNKRRSADATDYNVQIISAYGPPVLPAKSGSVDDGHETAGDASWAADVELIRNSKARARRTLFVAVSATIACSVALAIYWQ